MIQLGQSTMIKLFAARYAKLQFDFTFEVDTFTLYIFISTHQNHSIANLEISATKRFFLPLQQTLVQDIIPHSEMVQ